MKTKHDWCFRFFNSPDYLNIYEQMTGDTRTQYELRFCEDVLGWDKGQWILDAPCGSGRHALPLAQEGMYVVGVDISDYLTGLAKQQAESMHFVKTDPYFLRGLLQALPLASNTFDYAISLFSSFGYGDTEGDHLAILREYERVLVPGGKVLIDVMNRHFILPRLNRVFESRHKGLWVREERTLTDNKKRLHNRIVVTDQHGEKRQYLYNPWLFNGFELSWLATRVGLKTVGLYGNFQGENYETESERAILVAEKG